MKVLVHVYLYFITLTSKKIKIAKDFFKTLILGLVKDLFLNLFLGKILIIFYEDPPGKTFLEQTYINALLTKMILHHVSIRK